MLDWMTPITHWHWWVLAGLLVIIELLAPGFFFLWLAAAAGLVGLILVLAPELPLTYQLLSFSALAFAALFSWRRFGASHQPASDHPDLNRRAAQYLGRRVRLVEAIREGRGRVRLGDGSWSVTGPSLPAGTMVEIVGVDGAVLEVDPVPEDEPTDGP